MERVAVSMIFSYLDFLRDEEYQAEEHLAKKEQCAMRTTRMAFAIQDEKTALIVRAGLPRTLWTLGIFAECSLLFAGCYLLMQATVRPLEADQTSVLAAGVILALAATLFVYLVRLWCKAALVRMQESLQAAATGQSPLTAFGEATRLRQEAERVLLATERLPEPM
jgi:hypothetical protein